MCGSGSWVIRLRNVSKSFALESRNGPSKVPGTNPPNSSKPESMGVTCKLLRWGKCTNSDAFGTTIRDLVRFTSTLQDCNEATREVRANSKAGKVHV